MAVRVFEMRLKLFCKMLENINLCLFSSSDLLRKSISVSVPFPSVRAVEMVDSLAKDFEMRFIDFHIHATNIRIFENPFFFEVSNAPNIL